MNTNVTKILARGMLKVAQGQTNNDHFHSKNHNTTHIDISKNTYLLGASPFMFLVENMRKESAFSSNRHKAKYIEDVSTIQPIRVIFTSHKQVNSTTSVE